ncbi:MAG TPA: nitroreductase family protein, partial [Nocardioides sp.]|nr:nitroreductase family protein [Nocardioides sp.]
MEFQDVVRRRRMVRNYSTDPVDPAVVDLALRNATRAPNAGFSQGWAFLVLDTPADVRRFWEATADDLDHPDEWLTGMMRAPVVILPCSSKAAYLRRYAEPDKGWTDLDEARWPKPFWDMDTAMASLLILQ